MDSTINTSFDKNVLNKITPSYQNQNEGVFQQIYQTIQLSQFSKESAKLLNFIVILIAIASITILTGIYSRELYLLSDGCHNMLHIAAFSFSLFTLIKAKKSSENTQFTYGFTRYETISAFSNCVFLLMSSLFMLMTSFHDIAGHEGGDGENAEHETKNYLIYFLYMKMAYNLFGVFSFAEYALFVPSSKLNDIGADGRQFAYTGVTMENFYSYEQNYSKLFSHLKDYEQIKEKKENNECLDRLKFTSHFENMHSIFLHFIVDLLFVLGQMAIIYLNKDINHAGIYISFFIMIITIILSKKLFTTCGTILLGGVPINDPATIQLLLSSVQYLDGVMHVEEKKFWAITNSYLVCHLNVRVRNNVDKEKLRQEITKIMEKKFYSVCIQLENDE